MPQLERERERWRNRREEEENSKRNRRKALAKKGKKGRITPLIKIHDKGALNTYGEPKTIHYPFCGSGYIAEKQFATCLRKYSGRSVRRKSELRKTHALK